MAIIDIIHTTKPIVFNFETSVGNILFHLEQFLHISKLQDNNNIADIESN